jgi:hypothetical protein
MKSFERHFHDYYRNDLLKENLLLFFDGLNITAQLNLCSGMKTSTSRGRGQLLHSNVFGLGEGGDFHH